MNIYNATALGIKKEGNLPRRDDRDEHAGHLLSTALCFGYLLGLGLCTEQERQNPCPHGIYILGAETGNQQANLFTVSGNHEGCEENGPGAMTENKRRVQATLDQGIGGS